jgi:hypothetical protein
MTMRRISLGGGNPSTDTGAPGGGGGGGAASSAMSEALAVKAAISNKTFRGCIVNSCDLSA